MTPMVLDDTNPNAVSADDNKFRYPPLETEERSQKFEDTQMRIVIGVVILKTIRFHCYIIETMSHYYKPYFTIPLLDIKIEFIMNVYHEDFS
jgi:hypothetical protein